MDGLDFRTRWCTITLKIGVMKEYLNKIGDYIEYLGIAADEPKRTNKIKANQRHPLYDWGITEKNALAYCYSKGFTWGGLYEKFDRVSCYLCPLQPLRELRKLYNEFPELWSEIKRLDKLSYRKFRADCSIDDLEKRFKGENQQIKIDFS